MLFHRQPGQPGKHPGEVDAGGAPLLPERSHHPCRQQEGSSPGRDDQTRTYEDETGTGETGGGKNRRREDQRVRIPRVLGKDQGRRPTGVRNGHQGGASDEEETEDRMPAVLAITACSRVLSAPQTPPRRGLTVC